MLVNLTPNALYVRIDNDQWLDIPPSGAIASVREKRKPLAKIDCPILPRQPGSRVSNSLPVFEIVYNKVSGLPDPMESVTYIVSERVAARVSGRRDVVFPGPIVKTESGRFFGYDGFSVYGLLR